MADIGTIGPNGETDLPQPIKGDGFALTHDPASAKWRADVWANGAHRAVPFMGEMTARQAEAMGQKLLHDFPEGIAHQRAQALHSQMLAMFGG